MADTALEITLRCATDLNKVNLVSKMDVYAVVSISGSGDSKKIRTPTDRGGGSSPTWNFPIRLSLETEEAALLQSSHTLDFKLVCERSLGDKDVGEVHVPIKELLDSPAGGGRTFVSYQVMKPSGRPKGELTFSYKFIGFNRKPALSPAPPMAESKSRSVYPLAEKVRPKPMAMYPMVELESKSVYPLAEKGRPKRLAMYPVVEFESKSMYPSLNPTIEAGEGHYPPPAPYKYGYPSPEPSYWYPPSPGNLYPPLPVPEYAYSPIPKAPKVNNNFGSSVTCS